MEIQELLIVISKRLDISLGKKENTYKQLEVLDISSK